MSSAPMMGCGHSANGKRGDDPVCVICFGIKPGANVIADGPDLSNRQARCACGQLAESSTKLPFFQYRPDGATGMDGFYCGHGGWD